MKKINLSLLVILFTLSQGFSQSRTDNEIINPFTNQRLVNESKLEIKNIKGSPYLNEEFLPVKVSKRPEKNLSARYNAYKDEIEIKQGNGAAIYVLNKKSSFSKVEFTASKMAYEAYDFIEKGEKKRGYLEKLNPTGNHFLLKKQRITFIDAKPSNTGYDNSSPAQFKKAKNNYFIKINEGNIIEFKKNKKDFAKLFPKHEKELLSYIKKQGINTKKEKDLIKLINYVNTFN